MNPCGRTQIDITGGLIIGIHAPTVFVNSVPISVLTDPIRPHGPGTHAAPYMVTGSPTVFAHSLNVSRMGKDIANCRHIVQTGSPNVFVGP